jgi:hypothetical protein
VHTAAHTIAALFAGHTAIKKRIIKVDAAVSATHLEELCCAANTALL